MGAGRTNWLMLLGLSYFKLGLGQREVLPWLGVNFQKARQERGTMIEKVVRLTVSMTVNDGQLAAFKRVAQSMTEGSKAESGTLGYEWFSSADEKTFRLVESYKDAQAVEAHFAGPVVQDYVPSLAAACTVNSMEFYGDPGPKVAEIAAGFGAVIFQYQMGIDR
jgi:quinol monooxygenase YgiN